MARSEESTNYKMNEYEKYLECYLSSPSTQRDCLMQIAEGVSEVAEYLEECKPDYIQELIEIQSEIDSTDPADIIDDKITVYREVDRFIGEDIVGFRNGCHHFLRAFYQHKESVIKLIEDNCILNNVIKAISIVEACLQKLNDALQDYAAFLCYAAFEGHFEELERHYGKNAIKHFKKWDELTTDEYESAFERISAFMSYINENKFGGTLMELGTRLRVFCELKSDNSEAGEAVGRREYQRPVTLLRFMQKYCENQRLMLLKCRRKSLNDAHNRKAITLPENIGEWKSGRSKYYKVIDLKEKWPSYCEILPNLPPLK